MSARYFGLVPAAGSGSRFGSDVLKQYSPLGGKPMLYHSSSGCSATPEVEIVFVVLRRGNGSFAGTTGARFGKRLAPLYCRRSEPSRQRAERNHAAASLVDPKTGCSFTTRRGRAWVR